MEIKKSVCFLIAIFICMQIYAGEIESYNLQKKILITSDASEPQFIENYILFTFKTNEKVSFVGAAFDFDNYVKIYQYKKNPEGIYFLVINKPEKENIKYRLIVDGLWIADPFNPDKIKQSNLVELSVLNIADKFSNEIEYPHTAKGLTWFNYKGEEGKSVYLAGSFNKWDPFMYNMIEKRPGEYSISLKLPQGNYNYYFIVNGKIIPDIRNPNILWDKNYREISSYTVK